MNGIALPLTSTAATSTSAVHRSSSSNSLKIALSSLSAETTKLPATTDTPKHGNLFFHVAYYASTSVSNNTVACLQKLIFIITYFASGVTLNAGNRQSSIVETFFMYKSTCLAAGQT